MRVAVVGGGVTGLSSAWLLENYSDHEVHLYESDSRVGGHANAVNFCQTKEDYVPVETAFIVINHTTYPNFFRFLDLLGIETDTCPMSFSVSRDEGALEWASDDIATFFCQPTRALDPKMWRLLYDVLRFNACARKMLLDKEAGIETTIGEYLELNDYSPQFRDDYLIPMTAAVWSTPPDLCALDFPTRTLVQFMHNHHLLQLTGKPAWRVVRGGSKVYLDKVLSLLRKDRVHMQTKVSAVETLPSGKIRLRTENGEDELYDHVIMGTHSDTTLQILKNGNATPEEQRLLSAVSWIKNESVLHSDTALMPRNPAAWAAWNYTSTTTYDKAGNPKPHGDTVSVTFWNNIIQNIDQHKYGPVLVSINPPIEPRGVVGRWSYDHPQLDAPGVAAQAEMYKIQNKRGISFAGAWLGYGFHEDGFTSAMKVVSEHLGTAPPFEITITDKPNTNLWPSYIFEFLETTKIRQFVGLVLAFMLVVLRAVCAMFLDLPRL